MTIYWVEPPWIGVAHQVREFCVGIALRDIDAAFAPIGYTLKPEHREREQALQATEGQRRARATVWLERINWKDSPPHGLYDALGRLARAATLSSDFAEGALEPRLAALNHELATHGVRLDLEACQVVPAAAPLDLPTDIAGVRLELGRLEHSLTNSDSLATIGSAKNLVEATAKVIISANGGTVNRADGLPQLVARAHDALGVRAGTAEMPTQLRTMLGSVSKVAISLAELRNATDGSGGHGSHEPAAWVLPEHARLVADCALAWSRFMITTHDRRGAS